jgi:hypothetical protein
MKLSAVVTGQSLRRIAAIEKSCTSLSRLAQQITR